MFIGPLRFSSRALNTLICVFIDGQFFTKLFSSRVQPTLTYESAVWGMKTYKVIEPADII